GLEFEEAARDRRLRGADRRRSAGQAEMVARGLAQEAQLLEVHRSTAAGTLGKVPVAKVARARRQPAGQCVVAPPHVFEDAIAVRRVAETASVDQVEHCAADLDAMEGHAVEVRLVVGWRVVAPPNDQDVEAVEPAEVGEDVVVDRKSTRLNSSHVKTSYAVFCSKKQE